MFPLLLLAVAAALAFSRDKKEKSSGGGDSPSGSGGPVIVGPAPATSSVASACEFDASLSGPLRDQAMALLAQAETAGSSVSGPLATSLDTTATALEMSGLPKTAECLRRRAQYLRAKYAGYPGSQPVAAGMGPAAPIVVDVMSKGKGA